MKHVILHAVLSLALAPTLLAQMADLFVVQDDGGVEVPAGGTVVYAISYGNLGPELAQDVEILDVVPENTRFDAAASSVGWSCSAGGLGGDLCTLALGDLAPGATGSTSFVVRLDPVAAGVLENAVAITASTTDPDTSNNMALETTPVVGPGNRPDLALDKAGDGTLPRAGNTVAYTLTVANNGNQGAAGVVITETVPLHSVFAPDHSSPGWICNPADGPPGASCTLALGSLAGAGDASSAIFAVTILDPLAAGVEEITNTASVADDGTSGSDLDPTDNVATATTPIDPATAPDLVLTKDDGGVTVDAGDVVVYTLTASNVGDQDASGVVIAETVPAFTTFDAATSAPGWSCDGGGTAGSTCSLALGSIAGRGGSTSAAFAVRLDATLPAGIDRIVNTASVADDGTSGPDQNPADNLAGDETPIGTGTGGGGTAPDLAITKTDSNVMADPGMAVAYILDVVNLGNQGASGVVITETVPAHTTFDAATSSPGWSCQAAGGAGDTCAFDLGTLEVGESAAALFVVIVDSSLPAGVDAIENTAMVGDDGLNGPDQNLADNTATEMTALGSGAAPDLYVDITDGDATADAGQLVLYRIDFGNAGARGASGAQITALLPSLVSFEPAGSTAGWSCAGASCSIDLGTVMSTELGSLDLVLEVVDPLPAGVESLTVTVSITDDGANGSDLDPTNNTDQETTPIGMLSAPDLSITKDDGQVVADAGDLLTYTLEWQNLGNRGASGVVITETMPLHATFDPAASDPGWQCSGGGGAGSVCTLDLGTLNSGAPRGSAPFSIRIDPFVPAGVDRIVNQVTIEDDGSNGVDFDPFNNLAFDETLLGSGDGSGTAPDLALSLGDGGASVEPGGLVVYTASYVNNGNQGATGVLLSLSLPLHTSFVPMDSSAGWTCGPGGSTGVLCTLAIGSLDTASGGAVLFAVQVDEAVPTGVEAIVIAGSIEDDGLNGPDQNPPDNFATESTPLVETGEIDLAIGIESSEAVIDAGDRMVYTITYANRGDRAAGGVRLRLSLPEELLIDTQMGPLGWTCRPAQTVPRMACVLPLGRLDVGEGGEALLAVRLDDPVPAGLDRLVARALIVDDGTAGPDAEPSDNRDRAITRVGTGPGGGGTAPDLRLAIEDGDPDLSSGDLVTYALTVSNEGNQGATGIVLAALLPPYSTYEPTDGAPEWDCELEPSRGDEIPEDEAICSLALGRLEAGEELELELPVRLDEPLPAAVLDLIFLAIVEDDGLNGPDQTPEDNLAEETTHIGPDGPKSLTITRILVEMVHRLVAVFIALAALLMQLTGGWVDWLMGWGVGKG